MNASKLILGLIVSLGAAGAALAADADADAPAPLSRAEVLADLQIWRESGMAALHAREEPAMLDAQYDAVAARYAALRASPMFAALVERIARERGEKIQVAGTK
jgi:Domain of unknown function (DUF4148)